MRPPHIVNPERKILWDTLPTITELYDLLTEDQRSPLPPTNQELWRLLRLWICACTTCHTKKHTEPYTILSSREAVRAWAGAEPAQSKGTLALSPEQQRLRADLLRCILSNPYMHMPIWVNMDYKNNPGMGPIVQKDSSDWPHPDNHTNWITYDVLQNAKNAQEYQRFPCRECKGKGWSVRKGEVLSPTQRGERTYQRALPEGNIRDFTIATIDVCCDTCAGKGYTINGLLDPFGMMAVADSLEEAGCTEMEILNHLRHSIHCPNCWVLRMIVGEYEG